MEGSVQMMTWMFDQSLNAACITCPSVLAGAPILVVTHYDDDHSWAFLDGQAPDPERAHVVAMSTIVGLHPDVAEIASLPPGWSATRGAIDHPWIRSRDD